MIIIFFIKILKMYLIKQCFQDVKLEFRRVPECRILHHLPQTPGRTATAHYAVGQPAKRVERPLHVMEGYQVKKLRSPAGYLLTFSYFLPLTYHVCLPVINWGCNLIAAYSHLIFSNYVSPFNVNGQDYTRVSGMFENVFYSLCKKHISF